MLIRWYGQSAFLVSGEQRVFIDPFGDVGERIASRGMRFEYAPIAEDGADVVLVTHEHLDHNGIEAVAGEPFVIRSTAGRLDSPVGEVVAVAAEHDSAAGTERGPNTLFRFSLDGVRLCHLGDLGQAALRPEQRAAIGEIDVLFVPVGGQVTLDGESAAGVVRALAPRLVVPMHYRTPAIDFLEPVDGFLAALGARVETIESSEAAFETLAGTPDAPLVVLLRPPLR